MTIFQDAFISYGRADSKAFATQLNQRLIAEGLTVWFDFKDICRRTLQLCQHASRH